MVPLGHDVFDGPVSGSYRGMGRVTSQKVVNHDGAGVGMPVTDGGLPTSAGIVPTDASSLSTFLDE